MRARYQGLGYEVVLFYAYSVVLEHAGERIEVRLGHPALYFPGISERYARMKKRARTMAQARDAARPSFIPTRGNKFGYPAK